MKTLNQYQLPFAAHKPYLATSNPILHKGSAINAIDFLIEPSIHILAAQDGTVIDAKDDSNIGGIGDKFKDPSLCNWIVIKHNRGEVSEYVHIAHKSSYVKPGDAIRRGEVIATGVGMTGYTGGLHLHFGVAQDIEGKYEYLPINWIHVPPSIFSTKELVSKIGKSTYDSLWEAIKSSQTPEIQSAIVSSPLFKSVLDSIK